MKETQRNLIPFKDVNQATDRILIFLPFPSWVDKERMGVDVQAAERLMNLGGISFLGIFGQSNTETSNSMPVIVGISADGSLLGGRAATGHTVPLYKYSDEATNDGIFRNTAWTEVKLQVNMDEIRQRISTNGQNLRMTESWTPLLDRAVREGLRKAGTEHLLQGFTSVEKFFAIFTNLNSILSAADSSIGNVILQTFNPHIPTTTEIIISFISNSITWSVLYAFLYKFTGNDRFGYRISVIPGYEIDRALLLQWFGRTRKLIQPINPESDNP